MYELYAYAGMIIYLTMQSTMKANIEINYKSKSETNYCKTRNYATFAESKLIYIYEWKSTLLERRAS